MDHREDLALLIADVDHVLTLNGLNNEALFMGQPVRFSFIDKRPWFVLSDIAQILGFRDANRLARRLDEDELHTRETGTNAGPRNMLMTNESGLYNAIFNSNKPEAKQFKKWVRAELLPSIFKMEEDRFGRLQTTSMSSLIVSVLQRLNSATSKEISSAVEYMVRRGMDTQLLNPKLLPKIEYTKFDTFYRKYYKDRDKAISRLHDSGVCDARGNLTGNHRHLWSGTGGTVDFVKWDVSATVEHIASHS
jgi:prophage antirepressor-like protein